MPDDIFDNNRCIKDDLKKIRREINRKSKRFDLPLEAELESLLDNYSRKVSSSDKFQSDEMDVKVIRRMRESIDDARNLDSLSVELRLLRGFIAAKLSDS
ncbi:MAG: hypothetical protein H6559_18285 [Lewinellaceae bacterium]|nr:hypothetical protein [Sinomicrobium sp.]MCB9295052.1 hypothetical protein [Lewinellaceae bacterium]